MTRLVGTFATGSAVTLVIALLTSSRELGCCLLCGFVQHALVLWFATKPSKVIGVPSKVSKHLLRGTLPQPLLHF